MESEQKYIQFEPPTELHVKKVLAGSADNVRLQLIDAVETLGYDVFEDEPNILAKRAAKGWGAFSTNVLDDATTLRINLKAVSETSTRVIFDYTLKRTYMPRGDRAIVLQEAETIAAISKMQPIERMCSLCETESTDDSKFCRKCGAPLTSERTELEVLRIMGETRAAKSSVVTSSLMTSISAVAMLILFLLNNASLIKPKLFVFLMIIGGAGFLAGLIINFFGWNRLKMALNKPETQPDRVPRNAPKTIESVRKKELPEMRTAPASVTEGTTNLLDEEWANDREKEQVPVSNRRTTNDLN